MQLAGFAHAGARAAAALRVAALPLSRGPQLRAGCVDGPGPDGGLYRNPRPSAHLKLGDPQPARVRKAAHAGRAPAAQHSSAGGQALQALRHRPDGPARRAHSHRDLRRRAGRPRPDPGLGRRPLLGRPAAQRQDSRCNTSKHNYCLETCIPKCF